MSKICSLNLNPYKKKSDALRVHLPHGAFITWTPPPGKNVPACSSHATKLGSKIAVGKKGIFSAWYYFWLFNIH